jgi:hypothetical protein
MLLDGTTQVSDDSVSAIMVDMLPHPWPNSFDLLATFYVVGLFFVVPVVGYAYMVLDFRRYLRSLRRALIVVRRHLPHVPHWARQHTPGCLIVFGLRLPCNEEDLKRAFRQKVKHVHPDRGGDAQQFRYLQQQFELATEFLREAAQNQNTA